MGQGLGKMSLGCVAFLVAALAAGPMGFGQTQTTETPLPPHANQPIALDVVVTAKNGKPATENSFAEKDFTIRDNNAAAPIESFQAHHIGDGSQEMLIVVDAVNVGFDRVAYERDEIGKFLKADGGKLAQPTSLAIFTDTGTKVMQGFTTDGNALDSALNSYVIGLRTLRRDAGFYGATERLDLSLTALKEIAAREATLPGRKSVVWVSPGWALLSGPGIELDKKQQEQIFNNVMGLSTALRQARVTLYAVNPLGAGTNILRTTFYQEFTKGVSKPSQTAIGDLSLQVLAVQSGGLVLDFSNDIAGELRKCVNDGESYYALSFAPAQGSPGEYHHLQVQVPDGGLTVRTRDGYYLQP